MINLAVPSPTEACYPNLATNASWSPCVAPVAATILSEVKYAISSVNSKNVLPIIVCWVSLYTLKNVTFIMAKFSLKQ